MGTTWTLETGPEPALVAWPSDGVNHTADWLGGLMHLAGVPGGFADFVNVGEDGVRREFVAWMPPFYVGRVTFNADEVN